MPVVQSILPSPGRQIRVLLKIIVHRARINEVYTDIQAKSVYYTVSRGGSGPGVLGSIPSRIDLWHLW